MRIGCILAAALTAFGTAHAQPPGEAPRGPQLTAGIALGVTSQPYARAQDRARLFPIPLVTYRGARFQFLGKSAQATLVETDADGTALRLSAVADWRFQSYDAEDSPVLAGMDDRVGTLEAGGRISAGRGRYALTLTALADTLSRHGGYQVDAQIGADVVRTRYTGVSVNAGLRYQSSSLADYYFGVDPEEALAVNCIQGPCEEGFFRPAYETGGALLPSVGLTARQALSRRVSLFGIAQYEVLPDAITDSPIVDRDGQVFAFAGVSYAFGGR